MFYIVQNNKDLKEGQFKNNYFWTNWVNRFNPTSKTLKTYQIRTAMKDMEPNQAPCFENWNSEFNRTAGKNVMKWLCQFSTSLGPTSNVPESNIIAILDRDETADLPKIYRPAVYQHMCNSAAPIHCDTYKKEWALKTRPKSIRSNDGIKQGSVLSPSFQPLNK